VYDNNVGGRGRGYLIAHYLSPKSRLTLPHLFLPTLKEIIITMNVYLEPDHKDASGIIMAAVLISW
jgi:hypothetical protein